MARERIVALVTRQASSHHQETTMRFMIMHKNDANTEAGNPPPMELVHKMGEFIGSHAKAGRFIDGAGLGASRTRTNVLVAAASMSGVCRSSIAIEGPARSHGFRRDR